MRTDNFPISNTKNTFRISKYKTLIHNLYAQWMVVTMLCTCTHVLKQKTSKKIIIIKLDILMRSPLPARAYRGPKTSKMMTLLK